MSGNVIGDNLRYCDFRIPVYILPQNRIVFDFPGSDRTSINVLGFDTVALDVFGAYCVFLDPDYAVFIHYQIAAYVSVFLKGRGRICDISEVDSGEVVFNRNAVLRFGILAFGLGFFSSHNLDVFASAASLLQRLSKIQSIFRRCLFIQS